MKPPVAPPPFSELLHSQFSTPNRAAETERVLQQDLGPAPGGKYKHWDTFRHAPPLAEYTAEQQWLAVKMARKSLYRNIPLRDSNGHYFRYAQPNVALEMLHQIDRYAGGSIQGSEAVTDPATRDTYLFKSIVEEAISSSQLEGASTTRLVAKEMIQAGRTPQNRSERMILNNYEAMRYVRQLKDSPLTPAIVSQLQKTVTEGTLDDPSAAGRYRREDEHIVIEDETGTRLHTPPPAGTLPERVQAMCDFANGVNDNEFVPPAVRAILLHFWLANDHPFVDGNGRTARALFYWSMARSGYWLCEFVAISRILKKARGQYARSYLYTESDDNDLTYFLLYQMRVLLRAIEDLHNYLARKDAAFRSTEALISKAASLKVALNYRQLALLQHALKTPTARYTVESHRVSHGVSYETARSDLMKLRGEGLLEQRKLSKAHIFVPANDLRAKLGARAP
jgi:Fic family protein